MKDIERGVFMSSQDDYRKRADECVALAQNAGTPQQRTMLLHIADTWLRLADDSLRNVPVTQPLRERSPRKGRI